MNSQYILKMRLHNQLLAGTSLRKPEEIVAYMGAMQAQEAEMSKWGVGARLKGAAVNDIEESINTGKIIRTHILRPTWHLVSAEDIHWMTELSAPRVRPIIMGYWKARGFNEEVYIPAIRLVEKLLKDHNHLTRQEISDALIAAKITSDPDLTHCVTGRAEIDGIVCNGRLKGRKNTFALLEERVPKREAICKEEALERLARRFFTSHGPATIHDFAWWSGMTLTDARKALEQIKHDFISEEINGRTFWMRNDIAAPSHGTASALLLPPFDEFVVSYKERSEMIEDHHYGKVMTKNGLFSPTAMLDGEIVGSWRKVTSKGKVGAEISFFEKPTKNIEALFEKPVKEFADFYK